MDDKELAREFESRGPWRTRFLIDGHEYGAAKGAITTDMTPMIEQCFPEVRTILELGSLEGGRTFPLARLPRVERIVAVEARKESIERARFVQSLLGLGKIEWVQADLERLDLTTLGRFDLVLCSGVLYHMPKPWDLIGRCARVSPNLFLQTHYALETETTELVDGWRGRWYEEDVRGSMAGLSQESFWLTMGSLIHLLLATGYGDIRVLRSNLRHRNGPWIILSARG